MSRWCSPRPPPRQHRKEDRPAGAASSPSPAARHAPVAPLKARIRGRRSRGAGCQGEASLMAPGAPRVAGSRCLSDPARPARNQAHHPVPAAAGRGCGDDHTVRPASAAGGRRTAQLRLGRGPMPAVEEQQRGIAQERRAMAMRCRCPRTDRRRARPARWPAPRQGSTNPSARQLERPLDVGDRGAGSAEAHVAVDRPPKRWGRWGPRRPSPARPPGDRPQVRIATRIVPACGSRSEAAAPAPSISGPARPVRATRSPGWMVSVRP